MKTRNFITSALLTAGAVLLYQKKDDILAEITETKDSYTSAQESLSQIKQNLATIKAEESNLKQINQDLNYKFKAFNKELQAHLSEIKKVTDKYQTK